MNKFLFAVVCLFSTGQFVKAAEAPPKGFEDATVLKRVMAGEIVTAEHINTDIEKKATLYSFYPKTSTEAYIKLRVNYERYPSLFPEIISGKTTVYNKEKTSFSYVLDMIYEVGPITLHVFPEGTHYITYAKDATSEALVKHLISNYTQMFDIAQESLRLIPYQGGILIEDSIHSRIKKSDRKSRTILKLLVEQFEKFTEGFRNDLAGPK